MTTSIQINCGCLAQFKGEKVEHFGKLTSITHNTLDRAIKEAQQHVYETGHTVDGFIRITLDSDDPVVSRKSRKVAKSLSLLGSLLGETA